MPAEKNTVSAQHSIEPTVCLHSPVRRATECLPTRSPNSASGNAQNLGAPAGKLFQIVSCCRVPSPRSSKLPAPIPPSGTAERMPSAGGTSPASLESSAPALLSRNTNGHWPLWLQAFCGVETFSGSRYPHGTLLTAKPSSARVTPSCWNLAAPRSSTCSTSSTSRSQQLSVRHHDEYGWST